MKRVNFRTAPTFVDCIQAARAVLAATSMLALIAASDAFAQQPPAAQPKAQPKQSAPKANPTPPQGQAPAGASQGGAIFYSPWTKVCQKEQTPAGEKELCNTEMVARLDIGQLVAAATLIEVQGEATKLMRIMLPLGTSLLQAARFAVDKDEPVDAPYLTCFPGGCLAQREVTAEFATKLKRGQVLVLQGTNPTGHVTTYQLPLTEFAKANEGAPASPEAVAQQQSKLEQELQERARQRRESLERQKGAPTQGGAGR